MNTSANNSERIPTATLADESTSNSSEQYNLYEKREKIYTRKIDGIFQRLRFYTGWPLLVGYFILPWLSWNNNPLVQFDLPGRKFHILFYTFWPQDFPLLAWLLIIAVLALFFVTVLAGRLWCGYTCPQTVWTAIYMWAEQVTEGDRNQRIKLDKSPLSWNKVRRKTLKHSMWLGFAFLTGFTFIGYFSHVDQMARQLFSFSLDFPRTFWILFFTATTYVNAGFMREQLCKYACPYARLQAVMFDNDTLIVSYDPKRGDPRGSRKKNVNPADVGLGECIDCQMCVQVCPTDIDIRDGLQYECIGCALCIDACDSIMSKMQYPKGLIRYTSEHELQGGKTTILRPRSVIYGIALIGMSTLFIYNIFSRIPLELDIIRERGQLFRVDNQGRIENFYTLKVLNMDQKSHRYQIDVSGLTGLHFEQELQVDAEAGEILEIPVRLSMDPAALKSSNSHFNFTVYALDDNNIRTVEESRFIGPAPSRGSNNHGAKDAQGS